VSVKLADGRMLAVYVAGKMSDANSLEFLRNLDRMQAWTAMLRELGFAPFPVADDFADIMRTRDTTVEMVKEASMVWLRKADTVFVTPNWETSAGVKAEIAEAQRLDIPVFYADENGLEAMLAWAECGMGERERGGK